MEEQNMNAQNCNAITDAGCTNTTETDRYGFLVPACAMIGLGAGFLTGFVGTGVLVGVGVGLLTSGLLPAVKPLQREGLERGRVNGMNLLIGAFLVFAGVSLVLAPAILWPYAIAGFLILLGAGSLVRGFGASR
jgi:hypothetical protein